MIYKAVLDAWYKAADIAWDTHVAVARATAALDVLARKETRTINDSALRSMSEAAEAIASAARRTADAVEGTADAIRELRKNLKGE